MRPSWRASLVAAARSAPYVVLGLPAGALIATDIALPITMLTLVLGEMRSRTRRLQAMESMTESIASAQQYGSVVQCAVEKLQQSCGVRACWFRLIEGGHLVATHAAGLSGEFLRDAGFAAITDDVSKLWEKRTPKVEKAENAATEPAECLGVEKIRQLVIAPVVGNKAPVGLLMIGFALMEGGLGCGFGGSGFGGSLTALIARRLGLSVDWRHYYTTIDERSRRASQVRARRLCF